MKLVNEGSWVRPSGPQCISPSLTVEENSRNGIMVFRSKTQSILEISNELFLRMFPILLTKEEGKRLETYLVGKGRLLSSCKGPSDSPPNVLLARRAFSRSFTNLAIDDVFKSIKEY